MAAILLWFKENALASNLVLSKLENHSTKAPARTAIELHCGPVEHRCHCSHSMNTLNRIQWIPFVLMSHLRGSQHLDSLPGAYGRKRRHTLRWTAVRYTADRATRLIIETCSANTIHWTSKASLYSNRERDSFRLKRGPLFASVFARNHDGFQWFNALSPHTSENVFRLNQCSPGELVYARPASSVSCDECIDRIWFDSLDVFWRNQSR